MDGRTQVNNSIGQVPLSTFFDAIEQRLDRTIGNNWITLRVEVCGKLIELRFADPKIASLTEMSLRGRVSLSTRTPDAVCVSWSDDCSLYVGEQNTQARWWIRDGESCLSYVMGDGFIGCDAKNKVIYYCHMPREDDSTNCFHLMYRSFYQWARLEGLLLMHAAVVGVDGKGVLIGGRGGVGKSTLSVACLLGGLDFVSDDYVMLTGEGPLQAMPLYSMVSLNPDMHALLKPELPILWRRTNGKVDMDASGCHFADKLDIKAIVLPNLNDVDEPVIAPVATGTAVTRMVYSILTQVGALRDTEPTRIMSNRLATLPAFEYRQSQDPMRNVEFLRNFIKEL